MNLFSKSRRTTPDTYRYDIPENVRMRLLHTIADCVRSHGQRNFSSVAEEVSKRLIQEYGTLRQPVNLHERTGNDIGDHLFNCTDEEVLDFLQLCFETHWNCGGQPTVNAINAVFEDEGIGYELTNIISVPIANRPPVGKCAPLAPTHRLELPRIIRKDEKLVHKEVVQPCLHLLADPRFATANTELIDGMEKLRKARYADAVNACGSAFESVLRGGQKTLVF